MFSLLSYEEELCYPNRKYITMLPGKRDVSANNESRRMLFLLLRKTANGIFTLGLSLGVYEY